MLAPYRSVLATPGAKQWSLAGFVARMPISMVTLGIVLLVVGHTGSYGLAGGISAAYMVTAAVTSPVLARLIDAWGQGKVLVPAVVLFSLSLGGLVLAVLGGWPTPLPHVFGALAGAMYPPVGACIRARWAGALGESAALHTAYSLEAVVDEAIFMVGPVLVTVLATSVDSSLGIAAVVAFALVGGFLLAGQRSTEPPARGRASRAAAREPMGWRWLAMLVLAAIWLGVLFGATEVVTVAFAQEQGHRALAGPLLATWSSGSFIAGIITGSVHWQASPLRRYRLGAVAMACVMVPLPFIHSIPLMTAVLFLAGFAISPTLVACVSLVQLHVPAARLTEGITWVMTGIGLGIAPAAAVAGWLIDRDGASTAYFVPVVGGLLAALTALLTSPGAVRPPSVDDAAAAAAAPSAEPRCSIGDTAAG